MSLSSFTATTSTSSIALILLNSNVVLISVAYMSGVVLDKNKLFSFLFSFNLLWIVIILMLLFVIVLYLQIFNLIKSLKFIKTEFKILI